MNKKRLLTDVQFAYMAGRNENIYLGGVSTHFYIEFDRKLVPEKLELAVNKLIKKQEMMRAYISDDGTQTILDKVPYYKVKCEQLDKMLEEDKQKVLSEYRKNTSNRIFELGKWPMFEFHLFKLDSNMYRLAIDFDMMIVDGMSTELIIQEILHFYEDGEDEKLKYNFSDYLDYKFQKNEDLKEKEMDFWNERIEDFISGPFLNKVDNDLPTVPQFDYVEQIIDKQDWDKIKVQLKKQRILPSIYLLTSYAKTVSKWMNCNRITINMTISDRKGEKGMNLSGVIGDFTKIIPIDFDFTIHNDIYEICRITQQKISLYKKHLNCNMLAFAKEVCNKDGVKNKAAFPFVFTGMFFDLAKQGWNDFGERVYQVSQTPQVLLDNQITLKSGELTVHWDFPKQYWIKDKLKKMQDYFMEIVLNGKSDSLKNYTMDFLKKYNNTKKNDYYVSPIAMIKKQAVVKPDDTAIMTKDSELTYEELDEMSTKEANYLIEKYGYKKGFIIEDERHYTTIVHMLAVAKTGGFYVPIQTDLPSNRKHYIMEKSEAEAVLTRETYNEKNINSYSTENNFVEENPDDLLYVIYTSGTTGQPKGVKITRKAMMNTVLDINNRFQVKNDDTFICISSFGFDLSVYDVFGALIKGASIFIHDSRENVYDMIKEIDEFKISVWNTVPAIMQLLVNELDENYINTTLRLVLLSGDWISIDLINRIKSKFINAQIISLGGATEASIWSIYFPIKSIESQWKSIPYGYPLSNQKMYILGYDKDPLPKGVEGDIYIGGDGLSLGYQNDEEKTNLAFINHPVLGRLYYTGDRGYFSEAGYMVFCGRYDGQVKIHGNRIELGEIETCIKKLPNIVSAIAQVVSLDENVKKLFAYYVPSENGKYDVEWIDNTSQKQKLVLDEKQKKLPSHITVEEYVDMTDALEKVSSAIINNAFYKLDFFTREGQIYSIDELFLSGRVVKKYNKLLNQWADVLAKEEKISKIKEGIYKVKNPLKEVNVDELYHDIKNKRGISYWKGSFEFLDLCNKNVINILKADVNPLTILFPEGETNRAENIYRSNPVAEYMNMLTASIIEEYVKNWNKKRQIRILEFGAGTGGTTKSILERVEKYEVDYTFTDISTFFTEKAKEQFKQYDFVKYGIFNIDELPQKQGYSEESFDIIIGANVLHDAMVIKKTLKNFRYLLSKEGLLVALEVTTNKIFHKVSIGFIEGFSGYNDERLKKNEPLLTVKEWKNQMKECGFTNVQSYPNNNSVANAFEQHVMCCYASSKREYTSEKELLKNLKNNLPPYMIPDKIYSLYELPLNKNSKVDFKELPFDFKSTSKDNSKIVKPVTRTEKLLHEIMCEILDYQELSIDANIFTLGADSLKSISIITRLKKHNMEVSLSDLYKYSTIKQLADFIENFNEGVQNELEELSDFKPDLEHRYDPFPLSDLQESYYIGAHETEGFNSIPTAGYVEIECPNYDNERLNKVIKTIIERHDILRAYIDKDGIQHVLKEVKDFRVETVDLRRFNKAKKEEVLAKTRKDMVASRLDLTKAPLFKCIISQIKDDYAIIHIYADGQIMDGWSFQLFFTELGKLYKNPDKKMPPLKVTFRDYIRYREAVKTTQKYENDKKYWMEKINSLPAAGVLPLENDIDKLDSIEGIQVECGLDIESWKKIEKKAIEHGVSAFSVLMTSFALAVAKWNDKRRFLLNIPEFYRPKFHEDIYKILGECASFLLFTVDDNKEDTFCEKVIKTQQQIMELKDHNSFSGMEVTREIYRNNNGYNEVLAPLVFGMLPDAQEFEDEFINIQKEGMRIRYQENHTSQIWIDVNTCVYSDRIEFNYNSLKGLIKVDILKKLAEMQKSVLLKAANDDNYWNSKVEIELPEEDKKIIDMANNTEKEFKIPTMSLPDILSESFDKYANNVLIKMKDKSYTYSKIQEMVNTLAYELKKHGIKKGDLVAVYIGKGLEQIVSALAVQYIGAVYVPIEYSYSNNILNNTLKWIDCKSIIVMYEDKAEVSKFVSNVISINEKTLISNNKPIKVEKVSSKDVGIIIHTSGTTGRPKSVMIKHESLVNAIMFTNKRYNVSSDDSAIAVTNYAHDMSLYDIFGMIQVGASIVVPEESKSKDPEYWIELVKEHNVSIWNSVPAMLDMYLEALKTNNILDVLSLRLIILGGDYIKPSLLKKCRQYNTSVKFVSVGGPTETTLWNIFHDIEEKDIAEGVIPYGKPIDNNRYYILNENMQQVPLGVTATLYAAGIGVSSGYCENTELTAEKFIYWKGERLYNTGDKGHYREDGTIIFDGREDQQVKVNGKRIELSAISSQAETNEKVRQSVAILNKKNQIVLFYTGDKAIENEIRMTLEEKIPDYMVPKRFIRVERIPMTSNAKVDKKELRRIFDVHINQKQIKEKKTNSQTCLEELLKEKFCDLLELSADEVNIDSDFFAMGGNSLIAMKLLSQLRETFEVDITLTDLFTTSTIREMKDLLEERNAVIKI
ncbi:non-ribosomal peptide synthetase [Lachnobacterium bovis]|uniref:Nonribosomal peptide synthase n=1 Tax=Lachnobacterium bovis DSM 14045 TaxID=1122142 RepID=A0A1H3JC65_9FIRM|nr:non-ribosomal peptide synthetase [Lachnobacterium bovis]SDY37521.1 Nonribosomal peptide synthase [Lachnobacterium bovis DSM 14045]